MNTRSLVPLSGVSLVSIIGTLLVSSAILAPGWQVARVKDSLDVQYQVNAAETELEITSPPPANSDNKCKNNPGKKGCFRIPKNKTGKVTFTFTADDEWELKQFTICKGNAKITDACGEDLSLEERLEFFVMDDATGSQILVTPANGQVNLTQLGAGVRTFHLLDQNSIKQDYYYNIKACRSPTDCVTLDPPVENKGLK